MVAIIEDGHCQTVHLCVVRLEWIFDLTPSNSFSLG